jgi:nucleoside-diphosphate-sugar epimerase
VKVLVTGATGFTGKNLAHALAAAGHSVRALVRPSKHVRALADAGIDVFEGQLTSAEDVHEAAIGCSRIYHLAAAFRNVAHSDDHYWRVNVGGTLNVLAAARAHGCERLVHCSTGGVHGHIERPPADETYRFKPGDVYQKTKLEAELAVAGRGRGRLSGLDRAPRRHLRRRRHAVPTLVSRYSTAPFRDGRLRAHTPAHGSHRRHVQGLMLADPTQTRAARRS